MNHIKFFFSTITIFGLISCTNHYKHIEAHENPLCIIDQSYKVSQINLSDNHVDTLLSFPDIYPVGVRLYENNIIIKTAKSDSCIRVYDRLSLEEKWITGIHGQGPQDVLTPDFYVSLPDSQSLFQMIDVSDRSNILLDFGQKRLTKKRLPEYLGFSASVNITDNFTIGTLNNSVTMFFIHNNGTANNISVSYDIECDRNIEDLLGERIGYLLSAMTFANQNRGRIIVPHYFFDEYSIYDFFGNLLNKICLSTERFNERKAAKTILDNGSYIGYVSGFAKQDACYLVRSYFPNSSEPSAQQQLIKVDWNGTPSAIYNSDFKIIGQFSISEDNKLYVISQSEGEQEGYYLLCCDLNTATV